jgi:hypothetical protein
VFKYFRLVYDGWWLKMDLDISMMGMLISVMAVCVLCGLVVYECAMEDDVLMAALTLIAVVTS